MKKNKFLVYLLTVIIGVIVIDVIFRIIFTPIFNNPPINTKAGATYKFVSYNESANIIVLGASRASHHYRSEQMEDSLGAEVYNYGWDGRCVLYQYLCLIKGIKNGGLKTAILDISEPQLCDEWVEERISDLYPYYWKNDTVKMMVDEVNGKYKKLLMLSSLVQYNSQYLNLIAKVSDEKGYIPLPYTGNPLDTLENQIIEDSQEREYNSIALKYFDKIITLCKVHNVRLIVCLSPSLGVSKETEKRMQDLCNQKGVECWNLTDLINDPILFSDINHLNDKGAELFTNYIIEKLKLN